jgi:hypothetical protein
MKNSIYLLIITFILLIVNINSKTTKDSDLLFEWGKNNSVFISDKIGINYTSENIKNFYVKEEIDKNEVIMTIPPELILNIKTALNLYGPKTKKLYDKYKKEKFEYVNEFLSYRKQQSFLAYLMLQGSKHNNKFHKFFQYFMNTFETNLDGFPLFYNNEQFSLLTMSQFGNEIFQTKTLFEEEYSILDQKILSKGLDYDEYLKFRTYTLSKGNNITGLCSLIPFTDILDIHPTKYNLKLEFNLSDYGAKVIATKKIKMKRRLRLKVQTGQNSNSLIFYGKTFKELENTVNSFLVPYISSQYLTEKNMDQSLANNEKIDLAHEKFYEEAMKTYMDFSKKIKQDGSPLSALYIFKDNLNAMRKKYDDVSTSQIHKAFFTQRDIDNVKRVINLEKRFYDEKMKVLDVLIDYTINNKTETESKNKKEKDVEDIDLDL